MTPNWHLPSEVSVCCAYFVTVSCEYGIASPKSDLEGGEKRKERKRNERKKEKVVITWKEQTTPAHTSDAMREHNQRCKYPWATRRVIAPTSTHSKGKKEEGSVCLLRYLLPVVKGNSCSHSMHSDHDAHESLL